MTIEDVCAYAIAANEFRRKCYREQSTLLLNCISESFSAADTSDAREAETYADYARAMGAGI